MTDRAPGFGYGIMFATGLGRAFVPGYADQYVRARLRRSIHSRSDKPINTFALGYADQPECGTAPDSDECESVYFHFSRQ
jgi:hypothetical protein